MNRFSQPRAYSLIKDLLGTNGASQAKIRVHGSSMSPFIRNGSAVVLKPLNPGRGICIGDVLAARRTAAHHVLIHRVIRMKKKQVLLKGDNNFKSDGWFSPNCIIGRVHRVDGSGCIFRNYRLVNFLIAAGSRTGVLNRVFFPLFRKAKIRLIKNDCA